MIKLALKHWVFEKCIDMLFNRIKNNFNIHSRKIDKYFGTKFITLQSWDTASVLEHTWIVEHLDGTVVGEGPDYITITADRESAFSIDGGAETTEVYLMSRDTRIIYKKDIIQMTC